MPEGWDFSFNPLQTMSPAEQAELENKKADRDQKYFNMGIIDETVTAKQLAAEGTYLAVDAEYCDELEKIVEEEKEAAEAAAKLEQEKARSETFNIPNPDEVDAAARAEQEDEDKKLSLVKQK